MAAPAFAGPQAGDMSSGWRGVHPRARIRATRWLARDDDEFESADAGKPLAPDDCRQCRRTHRGFSLQASAEPYVPYIHLLVDYHFGFTKRALIGAVVSLFYSKVPVWLVFALSGAVWLITLALFVRLFRRTFGFGDAQMPLFVFMAGSPFFLKNFMHTLGHFDIYGAALAIGLLLVPARSITFVISAALGFNGPDPDPPHSPADVCADHRASSWCCAIISCRVSPGKMPASGSPRCRPSACCSSARNSGDRWRCPRRSSSATCRAGWPILCRTNLLSFSFIWYQSLAQEIHDTWDRMPSNLLGVPVFALLIWLHAPLWNYFSDLVRVACESIASPYRHRGACRGEPCLSGDVRDRVRLFRWISNWAVCMFLILHAVKTLPASREVPLISADDPKTVIRGWIVTLIPRVGIVRTVLTFRF